ncbi:hypothetical protein ABQJ54_06450 [Rhodanobacter sp. Si-c]|uniref:Uncharacterized protein n=1 Tax=Rhodanobacter lycopersici TaxID=3162487 RepID=A0ABV3QC19_9GAMM
MKMLGREWLARAFAWIIACVALFNTLFFVLRTANPVIRSDDWYSLDVFVRKAMEGSLGFADFFTRRYVDDHAQPLLKLVQLIEWRWFDLDYSIGAIVGVIAAAVCALILYRVVTTADEGNPVDAHRFVAWVTLTAVLLSLNSADIWAWPLVALGYVTLVPVLLFMWVVWHAWRSHRYLLLVAGTLVLCVVADDVALITVVSTVVALLFLAWRGPAQPRHSIGKMIAVMVVCTVLVRVAYAFAPLLDGTPAASLATRLAALYGDLRKGDGWQWVSVPFSLSVASTNPFEQLPAQAWDIVQMLLATCLLVAHGAFWWRALHGRHNLPTFMAMCLMLFAYGLLAGIILVRVSLFGSSYLGEDRYVEFYQFNLVALLLMWAGTRMLAPSTPAWRRWVTLRIPMLGCTALLLLQIPLTHAAWQQRRYGLPYYARMATQVAQLAGDATQTKDCLPELVVCHWPLARRRAVLLLLSQHRLNVLSPKVQARHVFLPRVNGPLESPASAAASEVVP